MERSWLAAIGRTTGHWLGWIALQFRKRPWLAVLAILGLLPGAIVLIGGLFVLALFLTRVLWAWTIPDLFPGAVEQGLIAETIPWLTALKIFVVLVFLGVLSHVAVRHESRQ